MRSVSFVLALSLLLAPGGAFAQNYAIQGAERYFRLEWETTTTRRGPVIAGYVYSVTGLSADRVQLAIDSVDGTGQVTGTVVGRVVGTVPSGNRAYFEIPVRELGTYRVRVLSFEVIGRGL